MSGPYPWLQFNHSYLDYDPIWDVQDETDEPLVVILGTLVVLMCLARRSPEPGYLITHRDKPTSLKAILRRVDLPPDRAERIFQAFEDGGLLNRDDEAWYLTEWFDPTKIGHQGRYDRAAERQRQYRKRLKRKGEAGPKPTSDPGHESERSGAEHSLPDPHDTTNDREVNKLIDYFILQTGLYPPHETTQEYFEGWRLPALEILNHAGDDPDRAKQLLDLLIQRQRDNKLNMTRLKSVAWQMDRVSRETEMGQAWAVVTQAMRKVGWTGKPDFDGQIAVAVKQAGGWRHLCNLSEKAARERFYTAYTTTRSEASDKGSTT